MFLVNLLFILKCNCRWKLVVVCYKNNKSFDLDSLWGTLSVVRLVEFFILFSYKIVG